MPVAQLTLEIRIEHAQSLKDRRQVVRSLKDQLKQSFNVSVAEMDEAVTWQSATIGVVAMWSWYSTPDHSHWTHLIAIFLMAPAAQFGSLTRRLTD